MTLAHASAARTAPVITKGHSHHASAAKDGAGGFSLAELRAGTKYWLEQYRSGAYSLKLFTEQKVSNTLDVLVLVRHKGAGPALYDLDVIEKEGEKWFAELEAGRYRILSFEEHVIDADDDLFVFVREKV